VLNPFGLNGFLFLFSVPLAMEQAENKTVQEGDNVKVYCNITAGIPDPTVVWTKVQGRAYNPTEGKLLNITNITRAQAGEYRCTAKNTCGEKSTVTSIDVQCKKIFLSRNYWSDSCPIGDLLFLKIAYLVTSLLWKIFVLRASNFLVRQFLDKKLTVSFKYIMAKTKINVNY